MEGLAPVPEVFYDSGEELDGEEDDETRGESCQVSVTLRNLTAGVFQRYIDKAAKEQDDCDVSRGSDNSASKRRLVIGQQAVSVAVGLSLIHHLVPSLRVSLSLTK
jgi:hypothetical protein